MTLVIYKNGMLAADTRATVASTLLDENDHCAHCDEVAHVVTEKQTKITLPPEGKDIRFRGHRVLVVGQAGNQALSKRMIEALMRGKDLETIYADYLTVFGSVTDNKHISSFLICCEDINFTVKIPKRGALEVKQSGLDATVSIGSDLSAIAWLNDLMPHLSASSLINLAMARHRSIGGGIKTVQLTEQPLKIVAAEKEDPKTFLENVRAVFAAGVKATAAASPRRTKKKES